MARSLPSSLGGPAYDPPAAGARVLRSPGPEPRREGRPPRAARVPAPLAALLVATLLLGMAWVFTTPAFQAPDEQFHFAYLQSLAERGTLPGEAGRPPISSEQAAAAAAINADQVAGQRAVRPEWGDAAEARWETQAAALARGDGGGPNPAAANPPLAYLWAALGYLAASDGDLFARLTAARLLGVLMLGVTVLGTWLLAGELLARRRPAQLVAAAVPALLPMVGFVSASVTPDAMLYALWSIALWLGVRALRRPPAPGGVAALFAVVGLACLVKATSYALLPGAVLVLGVVGWRARGERAAALRLAAAALLPLAVTLGSWVLVARALDRPAAAQVTSAAGPGGTDWRALASYLWSYYLPQIPGQAFEHPSGGYPAYQVWVKHTWGAFGWLEVRFAENAYRAVALLSAALGALAVLRVWGARRRLDRAVAGFLGLTGVVLLTGLHWTDYHQSAAGSAGFMQGRYLFPLIALAGVALAAAVELLPAPRRLVGAAVVLASLIVVNGFAFGLVWQRFYA